MSELQSIGAIVLFHLMLIASIIVMILRNNMLSKRRTIDLVIVCAINAVAVILEFAFEFFFHEKMLDPGSLELLYPSTQIAFAFITAMFFRITSKEKKYLFLFIVPVAEVCMICSAFGTAIGLISLHIPNLFAFVSGLCAKFILKIAQILSSLKILRLSVGYTDACLIFAGIFIFLALAAFMAYTGRKVFPLAGYLAAFIFVMSSVFFAFSDSLDTTLTVFDTGNGSAAYFRSGDDCILLGCGGDAYDGSYRIKKMLRDFSDETDAVILPEDTANYNSYLRDVSELVQGSIIYCPDPGYALKLAFPADKIVSVPDNFQIGRIKATLYKDGAGNSAYMFESKDMNLLYICEPGIDFASLPGAAKNCDVMLCRAGYPDDIAFNGLKLAVIQAEESRGYAAQEELTDKGLNAAATAGCGDIVITADDHNIKAVRR